jgi:hypothetical protein
MNAVLLDVRAHDANGVRVHRRAPRVDAPRVGLELRRLRPRPGRRVLIMAHLAPFLAAVFVLVGAGDVGGLHADGGDGDSQKGCELHQTSSTGYIPASETLGPSVALRG